MTDFELEKILKMLRETKVSLNKISKATHLSNATLKNYKDGKTRPTEANFLTLKAYFSQNFGDFSQNSGNMVVGNNQNCSIEQKQYYSDSPDVLRATIELLDERIREKDAQIREKDAQIREKDAQISRLLTILEGMSNSEKRV